MLKIFFQNGHRPRTILERYLNLKKFFFLNCPQVALTYIHFFLQKLVNGLYNQILSTEKIINVDKIECRLYFNTKITTQVIVIYFLLSASTTKQVKSISYAKPTFSYNFLTRSPRGTGVIFLHRSRRWKDILYVCMCVCVYRCM